MAVRKTNPGFRFYQRKSSHEPWELLRDDLAQWDDIKPTFVSVLRVDRAFRSDTSSALWEEAKYSGPLYFDFDDADDPMQAVRGAAKLIKNLERDGVNPESLSVFLSGGKGVHVIVPYAIFGDPNGEDEPFVSNLPNIYKEVAFKYATDCMDFRVYSKRSGRMWRTHYNQRENGMWKSPIYFSDMLKLRTLEDYKAYCSAPRGLIKPEVRASVSATLFTTYQQAYEVVAGKTKARGKAPAKQPSFAQARTDKMHFDLVSTATDLKGDKGWNHIAMQLAIYGRQMNWSGDTLIEKCSSLIDQHASDSYRYNTPKKRANELLRMADYLVDNITYEYAPNSMAHLLNNPPQPESKGGMDDQEFDPNLLVTPTNICAETENGIKAIANFGLTNCRNLLCPDQNGEVYAAAFDMSTKSTAMSVDINPQDFTGSASLQRELSKLGGVFIGTDAQARGLYHIIASQTVGKAYVIDRAGMNIVKFSASNNTNLQNRLFAVWMDNTTILTSPEAEKAGLVFEHRPNMASVCSDLSKASKFTAMVQTYEGKQKVGKFFLNLFKANRPQVIGRLLGWYVSCFYKQLFQHYVGSFPLLHIYGIAGAGKTETQRLLSRFFVVDEAPTEISPGTSIFAFVRLLSGSASIPIILDEWKPSEYKESLVGDYRGIMREVYNQKPWVRAGAAGKRDTWSGLTRFFLSAPLVYVGEAAETQTAIVERSVMVGFRRASEQEQAASYRAFLECSADHETLPALGRYLAARLLATSDIEEFKSEFDALRNAALEAHTLGVDDYQAMLDGKLDEDEYKRKACTKIRTLLGSCIVEYGLRKLQSILKAAELGKEVDNVLDARFQEAYEGLYDSGVASEFAVPEYVKVLSHMADASKSGSPDESLRPLYGWDFQVFASAEGKVTLRILLKTCWNKYMKYCRDVSIKPLFVDAASFHSSVRETHHYKGRGIHGQSGVEYLDLDYDSLRRSGCAEFPTQTFKVVALSKM